MRFRATTKWDDLEGLDGLLFFAQRAEELLFDYSLDSYKPATLNAVFLCKEAIRLITDIDDGLIDKNNLKPVMLELSWSISKDPVAKSLLDLPAESYILNSDTETLQRVRIRLEVLGCTLEPFRYLNRCGELLKKAIVESKKSEIDRAARLYFTTLINLGLHKTHLYERTVDFFYQGDKSNKIVGVEMIDKYIEAIYPYQHDFEILFIGSSLLSDVKNSAENAFGITFLEEVPAEVCDFANANGFCPQQGEVIAQVDGICALDSFSAREQAEDRLGQLRDLFTLYHHKTQIEWRGNSLIRQCCVDEPRIVGRPKNPIEKGNDLKPEKASQQLNKMLNNFTMTGRNFQKFNRAVDFHGLSVNNTNAENQLLNLWIALETIVPTHTGTAKIRQIVDGLLPFITMNYVWRLIGKLSQDLFRWNKHEVRRILNEVPGSEYLSTRMKVLMLVTSSDAEKSRVQLYTSLRDFHLLRYRVFSLSNELKTTRKTEELISLHEKKVAWQLKRIYRTRNLIVHSGHTPPYINSLIENGHDYLDQVIMTITEMCGSDYKIRTIEQAFELAEIAKKKLLTALQSSESHSETTLSLLINEHDFTSSEG